MVNVDKGAEGGLLHTNLGFSAWTYKQFQATQDVEFIPPIFVTGFLLDFLLSYRISSGPQINKQMILSPHTIWIETPFN